MYSLDLISSLDAVDLLSAELWEAGTEGIQELPGPDDSTVRLIAGFKTNEQREELLRCFAAFSPAWHAQPATDWVAETQAAWPAREVGERIFLAPPWNTDPTPPGRIRVIHNPGLACGTGKHPCTQLALMALERCVYPGCRVVDIGTGSGILAIAAVHLGAAFALGLDPDEAALQSARENFEWNVLTPALAAGSVDCVAESCADVTVANINASVLLSILDDLLRSTRPGGSLILTGFKEDELRVIQQYFGTGRTLALDQWCCLIVTRA